MKNFGYRFLDFMVAATVVTTLVGIIGMVMILGVVVDRQLAQAQACPAEQSDQPPRWEHTLPYRP